MHAQNIHLQLSCNVWSIAHTEIICNQLENERFRYHMKFVWIPIGMTGFPARIFAEKKTVNVTAFSLHPCMLMYNKLMCIMYFTQWKQHISLKLKNKVASLPSQYLTRVVNESDFIQNTLHIYKISKTFEWLL